MKTYKCSEVKRKCAYSCSLSLVGTFCDYIGIEGQSRGCPPEKCDKFKPKEGRRRVKPKL